MWITSNLQHRYTEDIIKAKVIRIEINWKDKHLQKNSIKILYLILDYPHKHYTFKHFEV